MTPAANESYSAIPKDLRELRQWLLWRAIPKDGRVLKVPFQRNGQAARTNDPSTWCSFAEAVAGCVAGGFSGIGFVFTAGDPYCGIDLDAAIAEDGSVKAWAQSILRVFEGTYAEYSPSGTGVHIFFRATLPGAGKNVKFDFACTPQGAGWNRWPLCDGVWFRRRDDAREGVEIYSRGRYFTTTGRILTGAPSQLEDHQKDAEAIYVILTLPAPAGRAVVPTAGFCVPTAPPAPPMPSDGTRWSAERKERHNGLKALGGELRARGYGEAARGEYDLAEALHAANKQRCDPPLEDKEVDDLVRWFFGRPTGTDHGGHKPRLLRNSFRSKVGDFISEARTPTVEESDIEVCENSQPEEPEISTSETETAIAVADAGTEFPDLIGKPFTDAGNAERLNALYGRNFRYSHSQSTFYVWDGSRFREDDRGMMRHLALQMARKTYIAAWECKDRTIQDKAVKHARQSESSAAISNALREVGCIPGISVTPDDLDRNAFLLNCRNGTVNLYSGELCAPRREDLITKLAPVVYDPAATCPTWDRFLAEVFEPHPDIPEFLQRAAGYSLTADSREECLFLLWGSGRNGKGVLLATLCSALGDYAGTADFSAFLVRRNEGPRDDIANMRGRRLVRAEESDERARMAEGIVKTLTGGDRVRARRLHENSYEFDPTWKIWLATNHRPVIRGVDSAIWSRLKLIPFEVSFAGREDRTLKRRLRDELPGILTWCVEGCLRWQAEGLQFPDSIVKATEEYRDESDQIQRFLHEVCVLGPDLPGTQARVLYSHYKGWATECNEPELSEKEFALRMKERGIDKQKDWHGRMVYRGVGPIVHDRADQE
jgi:putative DNA primase/helicase